MFKLIAGKKRMALLAIVSALMLSCDGLDGLLDGTDLDGNDFTCGEQTVTSLPPAGYVEFCATVTLDADPAASALGKVTFQAALCADTGGGVAQCPLYEIAEDGTVLYIISLMEMNGQKVYWKQAVTNQRLRVVDGCLVSGLDTTQQGDDDDFDPNDLPQGPCGFGRFAIDRNGVMTQNPQTPYICVETHTVSSCHDCWVEGDVWYERIVTTAYYVALGTLDGISVVGWAAVCDPQNANATVTISAGDRVDFTWTFVIEYRVSPSPEEMGYAQIAFQP